MKKEPIKGKLMNELNVNLFFETLAKIAGEQFRAKVTVVSIKRKENTEKS